MRLTLDTRFPVRGFFLATFIAAVAASCDAAERVPWTASKVVGSPDPPRSYHVERVYPALEFRNPVELMPLADTGKMMLLELGGKLHCFDDDPNCKQTDVVLDLSPLIDNFSNALGFAIHPEFDKNRQVFVVYTGGPVARPDGSRLSRFVMNEGSPARIDPASEEILLSWHSGGHNGCAIRFDSKGYLYLSLGDGARPYPPDEYDVSQDLGDLRATICRIDVDRRDGDRPYSIPADNPFIDTPGARPEIWAYGFRNPWRFAIDHRTDRLFCGDVGWELWELVYDVRGGGNYGWSIVEGPQPIRSDIDPGPTPIERPLVAYPHAVGQSVTGGIVYRGSRYPELEGAFLYGDYVTGLLWAVRPGDDERMTWNSLLAETGLAIITIAESRDREVLIVDYAGGIYRLIENPAAGKPSNFPRLLSQTGLFESLNPLVPEAGVYQYDLAAESYQRGLESEYVVAVPNTQTIKVTARHRSWNYPAGTVFARTLSAARSSASEPLRLETQMLHFDGSKWQPYSYVWNAEQTEAVLGDAGGGSVDWLADVETSTKLESWPIQNRSQCRACHSTQSGGAVGFNLANLDHDSPLFGSDNQLDQLVKLGILDRHPPKGWNHRAMVDPHDPACDIDLRARSYLSANCGHCHSRGGGGTVPLDLTFSNRTDEINAIGVKPTQGDFGIDNASVIAPGKPEHSVLFYRMATSGAGHMPKLATHDNEREGLRLLHDWIVALGETDGSDKDYAPTSGHTAPAGKTESATSVDEAILQNTSQALKTYCQLLFHPEAGERPMAVARAASEHGNAITAGLFERFLPPDQRRQRLGDQIDADQILAMTGDAVRGRDLFADTRLSQCANCHRVAGSGRAVGPDLDGVATRRTGRELLESIIQPSAKIEPQFNTFAVLTNDGSVHTGLKISENDRVWVIRSPDGKDIEISKTEIESFRVQPQSLMPVGLAATLTAQELADLLAYLESLK